MMIHYDGHTYILLYIPSAGIHVLTKQIITNSQARFFFLKSKLIYIESATAFQLLHLKKKFLHFNQALEDPEVIPHRFLKKNNG